ncbi:hypothetical protein TSOC_003367 [Tetrabaena socialis]|uniref:phytol kinase n=1 Tax=Tetrabaena socialis TaxID=47790 RepID=A0A2J8ABP5_9CHLO|nr:hypothetical protein TSOC_003367 [Tetrabaena socialis]|eukprot:PNH09955.1 hypothetical protein TSOC_003367 [Tetrabaena socialis]
MALPEAVRAAATQLPSAAARIAGVPGSGPSLNAAEADEIADLLVTVEDALNEDGVMADELVSDEALRQAMLRLVPFAVRWNPQQTHPALFNVAVRALRICAALLCLDLRTAWRARALTAFARKLLRMDTLQCCSRVFAEGVAQLARLAAGEAADGQALPFVWLSRLAAVCHLVAGLFLLAERVGAAGEEQLQRWHRQQQQLFASELAPALRDSCVMEHCARWLLHLQLAEAAGSVPVGWTARAIWVEPVGCPNTALGEALPGRCMRHLELSLGLAALCAIDGGPSYGLPYELLLGLPVVAKGGGANLRGTHGRGVLFSEPFTCMMRAMTARSAQASGAPPLGWRTVAAVLMRVGSLVLASARAWADDADAPAPPEGDAQPPPPPPQQQQQQLVLAITDIMKVADHVLQHLHSLLGALVAAAEASAPPAPPAVALVEAARAWWRLVVNMAMHCPRWAQGREALRNLAAMTDVVWGLPAGNGLLPPQPHWAVEAALAGGMLPLWERLLRRAGREPLGPQAGLLGWMLKDAGEHGGLWGLLAYGDPVQGAALVATWGKLLRALAVPSILSGRADAPRTALALDLLDGSCLLLHAAAVRLQEAADGLAVGGAAAAVSGAQQQLARLLALAAFGWLPPLARRAREGIMQGLLNPLGVATLPGQRGIHAAVAVMRWLPVLAAGCPGTGLGQGSGAGVAAAAVAAQVGTRAGMALTAAAAAAACVDSTASAAGGRVGAAAAPQAASDPAAAEWRQLLLREVCAVPLLGAVGLDLVGRTTPAWDHARGVLVQAHCLVAATCTDEVRQAVLAGAAASPRGGPGRGSGAGAGGGRRRGGRGASARGGGAGPSHPTITDTLGWSPQLLRLLASKPADGQEDGGGPLTTQASAALARQAELWAAGGGEDGAELARAVAALPSLPLVRAAPAGLIASPAEARALLRTCANPACDNLAGDSEAGLPLRACGRCGGAWYCRRECQAAHWGVHKGACGAHRALAAGPGAPSSGGS